MLFAAQLGSRANETLFATCFGRCVRLPLGMVTPGMCARACVLLASGGGHHLYRNMALYSDELQNGNK